MERLYVELFLGFHLDETHGWTRRGFGDSFRVTIIVLLRLDIGPYIFGRHQPDIMSLVRKQAAKVMRATTCLHRDDARRQLRGQIDQRLSLCAPTQNDRANFVEADDAANILAKINAEHGNLHDSSLRFEVSGEATTPDGGAGHSINLEDIVAEEAERHPERQVEVFASDEHRLGLKPVTRRVWAPVGKRPVAPGHHRFDWLYVTAFVSPASGETFWYVHDGVSKPFFSALLESFAREAGAGVDRTIVLVLDNAGWHGEAGLNVPDGVRLVFPPPCTPELQPAETLWALVDEPIVNKHVATIDELDDIIGRRCAALANERHAIKGRARFHWWPKIAKPK